jgi:hypothetical protein
VIQFRCEHCGVKLRVAESHAGKCGRCPKCKGKIAVPPASAFETPASQKRKPVAQAAPAQPLDRNLFDVAEPPPAQAQGPEDRLREAEVMARLGFAHEAPRTGERQYAWPIDILLYPANTAGLATLGMIVGIPAIFALMTLLGGPWAIAIGMPVFVVEILIGLYAAWYYAECVLDSAKGGVRAPMALDASADFGEVKSRVLYLVAVYILFVCPAGIYWTWTNRADAVLYGLIAWAVVFFPMGLLAMVIHDSTSALNPLFLLGAILRTFVPYVGLLILLAMSIGLYLLLSALPTSGSIGGWLLAVIVETLMVYLQLVLAHVLGRFYWRYRDRLDWGL